MGIVDNAGLFNRANTPTSQSHVRSTCLLHNDLSGQSNLFVRRPFDDGDCKLCSAGFAHVWYYGIATAKECKQASLLSKSVSRINASVLGVPPSNNGVTGANTK